MHKAWSSIEEVPYCFARSCGNRAANQYGTSVFCTDFTCKIREYEFGLQNTEIKLCQFCHLRYYCQNKAYLFWVANQSRFVVSYALKPSNTSLITKTFILHPSTCGSNTSSSCSGVAFWYCPRSQIVPISSAHMGYKVLEFGFPSRSEIVPVCCSHSRLQLFLWIFSCFHRPPLPCINV